MRLFSEEVKVTSSNSPLNILQVKDFQEVFFGVFEVQINEKKYVAEKISEENGNPIVSILVEEGNEKAQYPFLLLKGKQEIYFNSESEPVEIFESNIENEEDEDLEVEELIKETFDNSEIVEDKKQEILEEIKRVKRNAVKKSLEILEHNKAKNIQDIKNESRKKEKALKGYLESARENLVDEFTIISGKIKNELISDNDYKFDEIRESIDLKIQDIADNLNESLRGNFQNSSKLIDKSVKKLVRELYESNINPKVDKELKDIAEEIVEKVSEIDKNLNNKLDKKADVSLIEGVNKEIDAIRDANIELNNSLNKGVQKALSRVGNIDKKILEISEKFDNKISETEQEITQYFDEKLSLVKEETLDITDEARKYFQNLIQESRNGLLSEIRKIKNEKPVEYILESKTGKPIVKDWDSIEKDWNKKIHDKFENYKTDLRKYVAVYASGGGTNATQYQDGGTMNGDLTIVGNLSAGDIYSNGNRVATVVTPTRTTLSGNGVLSSFAISGAESLTNPSALIVATDGALQEPGVDYSVSGGYITFTSPLVSGAKAVVVSPTNTVQVLDMIPSDGSVTSAKLASGLSISSPTISNGSFTYDNASSAAHRTSLDLDRYYLPHGVSRQSSIIIYDFDSSSMSTTIGVTTAVPAGALVQITNAGGTHWNSRVKGWILVANGTAANAISELSLGGALFSNIASGVGAPVAGYDNYTLMYVFCIPNLTNVDIRMGLRTGNVARLVQIFQDNTASPGSSPVFNFFTNTGTYTTTSAATGAIAGAPTPAVGSYIAGTGTRYALVFDTAQRAGGTSTTVTLKIYSGGVTGDLTLAGTYSLANWNPTNQNSFPYVAVRNLNGVAAQSVPLHLDTVMLKSWASQSNILPAEILDILETV